MNDSATVLLVDDHALIRDMFAETLRSEGFDVVATGDTEEAIQRGVELRPDVAVLDIDMPGRSTFEVARLLGEATPATRIVFLSGYVRDSYIEQALAVHASGYLCKSDPVESIVAAIKAAAGGATCYSRQVLQRIVIDGSHAKLAEHPVTRRSLLTDRENEVLIHIARGLSQRQVAGVLDISVKTVQHHLASVMDKLDIHDRVELARYAIREGAVEP
jgi:DNA-binding NarL/FixJ family response regulator